MSELVGTTINEASASSDRRLDRSARPGLNLWRAFLKWFNLVGAVELLTETADLLIRGFFKERDW